MHKFYKIYNMKRAIVFLSIIFLFALCFTTCIREDFNLKNWDKMVDYDANFAIPLAYGDLTYYDIDKLAGGIKHMRVNNDGYLSLFYEGNYSTDSAWEHFKIPQTPAIPFKFTATDLNNNKSGNGSKKTVDGTFVFEMWDNDVQLTELTFAQGAIITYQIKSEDVGSAINNKDIYITFPNIKKNGLVFSIYIESANVQNGKPLNGEQPLDGYTLTLDQDNKTPVKFLVDNANFTGGSVTFTLTVSGQKYNNNHYVNWETIKGDFGEHKLISKGEKVSIEIFKEGEYYMDRFWFEAPKMIVDFKNSFGVKANFAFDTLKMINVNGVEIQPAPSGNTIPYASNGGTDIPTDPIFTIPIHKDNSNIQTVVSKGPRWLNYYATLTTKSNPNKDSYVHRDSKIEAKVTLELPLWGDVYNFTYADTSKFELPKILKEYDPIKKAAVRIDLTNGFPADMKVYVSLVDTTTGKKVDELLILENDQVLKEATVDVNGKVTNPERKTSSVEVTREKLEKWKNGNVNGVVVKAVANTTNVKPSLTEHDKVVKVYPEYKINFRIGIDFEVQFNENIDSIIDAIKDTVKK